MITDDLIPPEVLENVRMARSLDRDGWKLLVSRMSNFHRGLLHKARKQGEEQRAKTLGIGIKHDLNRLVLDENFLGGKYWMTVYCLPDVTLDFVIQLLEETPALSKARAIPYAH